MGFILSYLTHRLEADAPRSMMFPLHSPLLICVRRGAQREREFIVAYALRGESHPVYTHLYGSERWLEFSEHAHTMDEFVGNIGKIDFKFSFRGALRRLGGEAEYVEIFRTENAVVAIE